MILRLAAFTLCVLAATPAAHASPPQVVVTIRDPARTHQAIKNAAEQACSMAKMHDFFNDYGSMDECVDDAVSTAEIRTPAQTRVSDASRPSR